MKSTKQGLAIFSDSGLRALRSQLKAELLGSRAVRPAKGKVQCPFCATVYTPTSQEHLISGICDGCWPDDCELEDNTIDYGPDEDKPF